MEKNIKRGMLRIWVLVSVLWVGGMGWYQYHDVDEVEKNSFTIALSKDAEFRIDANGISKTDYDDKSSLQMQRLSKVFLPPLLLLLIFPVGTWLVSGFKAK